MQQTTSPFDPTFMHRALELAQNSRPSPNPRVGAVIVRDGKIVGEGFHVRPGMPHAEIVAIKNAGRLTRGADLYVTLEPCSHHGRTPPCVDAILGAGIRRVAVGMVDPDSRVNGQGVRYLRENHIQVETGIAENQCREMLEAYTFHRTHGRPQVTLKAAATLDGMLASTSGDSKWISSDESRALAHKMRAEADGIVVGINTVLNDDPSLTVRKAAGVNPTRIILDSHLRTPFGAKMLHDSQATVLIAHTTHNAEAIAKYRKLAGVELLRCGEQGGIVDLKQLLDVLGERGFLSLLVEGGGIVHGAFANAKLADKIALFLAPRILGSGQSWISFPGCEQIAQGLQLEELRTNRIADDLLIRGRLKSSDI